MHVVGVFYFGTCLCRGFSCFHHTLARDRRNKAVKVASYYTFGVINGGPADSG